MSLRIIRPGLLTTVQDLGRWGFQTLGVPVAGPMDRASHRLANLLVQNPPDAATLEVTLVGPDLEFEAETIFALTGAEFEVRLDGGAVPMNTVWWAPRGGCLTIGSRRLGARAYLAVAGGIAVPPVLGSRATHLTSRTGGVEGRALAAGDRLPVGPPRAGRASVGKRLGPAVSLPDGGARVRAIRGPQDDLFLESAIETLQTGRFVITAQSNRMGYRLEGPVLVHRGSAETISDATPIGTLQVPASGQPILLMADGQTAGGYPKLATVITADLSVAGQLAPGEWIEFELCDRRVAVSALIAQERRLMG